MRCMELRCNSSDSSTNSNACLTPGPPCCEMYSSRFASAARFTTTHLRNGGIVSPFPVILKSGEAIDPIRLHKTAYRSIMHGNTAVSQQFRICHLNPGL